MILDTVMKQIASLFIISVIGFYCGKKNIIDETFSNQLSKLLLKVTLPLLIISSFSFTYKADIVNNIVKAFIYGIIIFTVTPVMVKPLLVGIKKEKRDILQFAMVFSNCGFMGFPLAQSVFGNEGVIYASIFNMIFNIFVWTYGVMLFSEVKSIREIGRILKNPGIISALIGIFIMVFSIRIPPVLQDTMKMVGGLTTPISMMVIGSLLSRANFKDLFNDVSMYYGVFIKLLFIPVVLYIVSIFLRENSMVMKTFILMQAMPAGAITSLFAENFNKGKEYSVFIVSLSTLFSIITIPLIIKFCL
ncbi:AEC family transporter [Clostridium sp. WILCCON 0269]|uniref:AEC family transporter n=1 Tax=Candidatus Clostridium eludens TaxID=3381663 RepID=A0ABW8SIE0_9CLOT